MIPPDTIFGKVRKGVNNPERAIRYLIPNPRPFITGLELPIMSRQSIGSNVLHEEWDLLIILDTCRVDALRHIQSTGDYPWLGALDIEDRFSVGGSTLEWTAQTFASENREHVGNVDYISGNIVVEEVLDGRQTPEGCAGASWSPTSWDILSRSDFNDFVSAWDLRNVGRPQTSGRDDPHRSAEAVTDVAIQHGRETQPDRLIVHFIEPHYPYYATAVKEGRERIENWERFPFTSMKYRDVTRDEVWNTYLEELRAGLNSVETLLSNYSAEKAVITADHGEAFGEWFGYGHRPGTLHPKVRRVPWVETEAVDTGEFEPTDELEEAGSDRDEKLDALGYL